MMGSWYIDRSRNIASLFTSIWYNKLVEYAKNETLRDSFKNKSQDFCSYLQIPGKNPYAILTYLRDIGIIDDDNNATDFFKCGVNSKLSIAEFILLILLKRNDNKNEKSSVKPFVVLCKALSKMDELGLPLTINWHQCIQYLMQIKSYDDIDELLIKNMCNDVGENPSKGPDIWFNALLSTELFTGKNDEITLQDDGNRLVNFIAKYGDELVPNLDRADYTKQANDPFYGIYLLFNNHPFEASISLGDKKGIYNYLSVVYDYYNTINDEQKVNDSVIPTFDFASSSINDGQNIIVYGTPGCGKSYYVQNILLNGYNEGNYIRTTFFQDYTNTDFVGQILPCAKKDENGKNVVTYIFNPGPFTLALEKAIRNPNEKIALVIEELNRGSAASIFGDIFQLLDRKNGVSEYAITNVNIIDYLKKQFKDEYTFKNIKLPGNLSIFATMNTSDQNVFTLDTAFKRRWKFKKLINKFETDHKFKNKYIPGPLGKADYTWEEVVTAINDYILEVSNGLNSEDKQIGVYFIDEKGMRQEKTTLSTPEEIDAFAYKVFEYLWDDVAKFDRAKWFEDNIKSLDQLVEEYKKRGLEVFDYEVFHKQK